MFERVLVANRGEIAVRVLRTLRRLGVDGVAVYSDADAGAPHVRQASEAVRVGPAAARDSYLHTDRIVEAAVVTGCGALHPGYGFLSESAALARACADAGVVFVGPSPEAIAAMGDKVRARALAVEAGVPVLEGVAQPGLDDGALAAAARQLGPPLMVKAAAGGGGRGMRLVHDLADLPDALTSARRESASAFGDDTLYLERYLERPRHLEVQVLADTHGTVATLGVRECSLQRRHQKLVEETPAPRLDADEARRLEEAAAALARRVDYAGAGTVEFVASGVPGRDAVSFLEMNTRLQVEHPVTELVWGTDLVEQQLRVAAGERIDPARWRPAGHAVEVRLYAEDPARGFLPTGGRLLALSWPDGPGVRVDGGVAAGQDVALDYDPLLAKVIAHGADRAQALDRLDRALAGTVTLGVPGNTAFLRRLLADADVREGALHTGLVDEVAARPSDGDAATPVLVAALLELHGLQTQARRSGEPFAQPTNWRPAGPQPVRSLWDVRAGAGHGDRLQLWLEGPASAASAWLDGGEGCELALLRVDVDHAVVRVGSATRTWAVARDGRGWWLGSGGAQWCVRPASEAAANREGAAAHAGGPLRAPLPGTVIAVRVADGDEVHAGQPLVVVEAMKMEHTVTAPHDGTVEELRAREGQAVAIDEPLVTVRAAQGG